MNITDILLWVGFALAALLCLPFAGTRKLILELSALAVRLSLLALLAGGAVLWFRPNLLPDEVVRVVNSIPPARDILPSPESRTFGLATVCLAAAILIPCLAMLDVTRRLAGARLRRICRLSDSAPAACATPAVVVGGPPSAPRQPEQRTAPVAAPRAAAPARRG